MKSKPAPAAPRQPPPIARIPIVPIPPSSSSSFLSSITFSTGLGLTCWTGWVGLAGTTEEVALTAGSCLESGVNCLAGTPSCLVPGLWSGPPTVVGVFAWLANGNGALVVVTAFGATGVFFGMAALVVTILLVVALTVVFLGCSIWAPEAENSLELLPLEAKLLALALKAETKASEDKPNFLAVPLTLL